MDVGVGLFKKTREKLLRKKTGYRTITLPRDQGTKPLILGYHVVFSFFHASFLISIWFFGFMKLVFGTPRDIFRRNFLFYSSIQLIILFKVIIFFAWFGSGISYAGLPVYLDVPFASIPFFENNVQIWEYVFHQLMHVLIAVWVFLLAKNMKVFDAGSVAALFFIAVVMHNIGYWVTATHSSWLFSVNDFITDFVSLWVFFIAFHLLFRVSPAARKWSVPFLEEKVRM